MYYWPCPVICVIFVIVFVSSGTWCDLPYYCGNCLGGRLHLTVYPVVTAGFSKTVFRYSRWNQPVSSDCLQDMYIYLCTRLVYADMETWQYCGVWTWNSNLVKMVCTYYLLIFTKKCNRRPDWRSLKCQVLWLDAGDGDWNSKVCLLICQFVGLCKTAKCTQCAFQLSPLR
jgi:hypothetical protein